MLYFNNIKQIFLFKDYIDFTLKLVHEEIFTDFIFTY